LNWRLRLFESAAREPLAVRGYAALTIGEPSVAEREALPRFGGLKAPSWGTNGLRMADIPRPTRAIRKRCAPKRAWKVWSDGKALTCVRGMTRCSRTFVRLGGDYRRHWKTENLTRRTLKQNSWRPSRPWGPTGVSSLGFGLRLPVCTAGPKP